MKLFRVGLAAIGLGVLIVHFVSSLAIREEETLPYFVDDSNKNCQGGPCCPSVEEDVKVATEEFPGGEKGHCNCRCTEHTPQHHKKDSDGPNTNHVYCKRGQGYTSTAHTMRPKFQSAVVPIIGGFGSGDASTISTNFISNAKLLLFVTAIIIFIIGILLNPF